MLKLKNDLFSQILAFLIRQILGGRAIASFRENYKENIKIFIISDSRGGGNCPSLPPSADALDGENRDMSVF